LQVAETLYRHALYREATPLLEALAGMRERSIPRWKVAYLRGRCAFRSGDWEGAIQWYRQALSQASGRERTAELQVHLARALELGGRLQEAIDAARRAVRLRTTDDRRLFLARLRLRQGRPDLARLGISRARGWSRRERGEVMLALDELARGHAEAAVRRLGGVRHRRWKGPSAVVAAQVSVAGQNWKAALAHLEGSAPSLHGYWAWAAREVMRLLPAETLASWRQSRRQELETASARGRRRALAHWSTLEIDPLQVRALSQLVAAEVGLGESQPAPSFPAGLADQLWRLGLPAEAVRWDPSGMPHQDAASLLWSARSFLRLGVPWRAIRSADDSWRRAGSDLPLRSYPVSLQEPYFPLPLPQAVRQAADRAGVPWSLLAAVVYEESRWRPDALSSVGARGLMQLMPATAAEVASRLELEPPEIDDLFDPQLALTLGSAELARLLEVFDGRRAAAVAAYNAGQAQAHLWLEQCGQDCSEERYVLGITFSSTRAYTAKVLAAAGAYAELYRESTPVTAADGRP
jgi:soluble lytic murein transglycosylase-like protein